MTYIDCHNHSLPQIDDGAKSIEMSFEMFKISQDDGISKIVLTPHHLNGAFTNNKDDLLKSFVELKLKAQKKFPDLELFLGSEVHLVESSADEIISGVAATYGDKGKAALIELPKHTIPLGADKVLTQLIYNGITPVIAHPERNTQLRKDLDPLREWISLGCKSQLTAMSCEGKFGSSIQEKCFEIIENGLAHVIASDAHRPEGRSPKLSPASNLIADRYGEAVERLFFYENPNRLLMGEDLSNIRATPIKKKKRFLWF